jgi:hypothetical protein
MGSWSRVYILARTNYQRSVYMAGDGLPKENFADQLPTSLLTGMPLETGGPTVARCKLACPRSDTWHGSHSTCECLPRLYSW